MHLATKGMLCAVGAGLTLASHGVASPLLSGCMGFLTGLIAHRKEKMEMYRRALSDPPDKLYLAELAWTKDYAGGLLGGRKWHECWPTPSNRSNASPSSSATVFHAMSASLCASATIGDDSDPCMPLLLLR